jgi:hypothetical protein
MMAVVRDVLMFNFRSAFHLSGYMHKSSLLGVVFCLKVNIRNGLSVNYGWLRRDKFWRKIEAGDSCASSGEY